MQTQLALISPPANIEVRLDGADYTIVYGEFRNRLSPKWFVHREIDCANSKRFYSHPGGAANALFSGSIVWEK